jgi:hypothetical protein
MQGKGRSNEVKESVGGEVSGMVEEDKIQG